MNHIITSTTTYASVGFMIWYGKIFSILLSAAILTCGDEEKVPHNDITKLMYEKRLNSKMEKKTEIYRTIVREFSAET